MRLLYYYRSTTLNNKLTEEILTKEVEELIPDVNCVPVNTPDVSPNYDMADEEKLSIVSLFELYHNKLFCI